MISLSLKGMTLVGTVSLTVALLLILWHSCAEGLVKCDPMQGQWPMVSSVIRQPMCDRVWCILSTFFSLSVLQVNLRAYYAMFYPIATAAENDSLFNVGMITCLSFPLIGYFDEKNWKFIHGAVSGAFFIGTVVYANMLTNRF